MDEQGIHVPDDTELVLDLFENDQENIDWCHYYIHYPTTLLF